jgi:diguanylate cyclase (GGDEF)-like protein
MEQFGATMFTRRRGDREAGPGSPGAFEAPDEWVVAGDPSARALLAELLATSRPAVPAGPDPTRGGQAQPTLPLTPFDPLTGLPTRLLLSDRLSQALRRCNRSGDLVGLLYVELEGLDAVYKERGSDAGNWMLQTIVAALISKLRAEDTVSRVGPQEFVAFMTIDNANLMSVVESRVNETLEELVHLTDKSHRVNVRERTTLGHSHDSATTLLREVGIAV